MSPTPKQVLILRHAEKPGDAATDSDADGPHLSTRGFERAGALAVFIPARFDKPDYLFATQVTKHSARPLETITPLAKALGLEINSKHPDGDFKMLADDVLGNPKYAGKLVLICWHHGKIPELTAALGGIPPQSPWPGTVFDRVWQLDFSDGASSAHGLPVKSMAQMLLYGDASA